MSEIINWMESNMLSCFYVKYFGIECYGCGFQRSLIALMRGNLLESLKLFPALLPVLFTFSFTFFHLIFKFKKGASIIKFSFIFSVIIMVLNLIIKQFL
ncbi:DUF2752 domain-containing protein [Aureivirga marina]|uniref:DUF2752 domain-containing protein n=1 Tax=Aureivirga marina TaxID=1182451 RepID=UPI0018C916E3|nr:DUF2752 domain-containing protein [Aureivirga marina]